MFSKLLDKLGIQLTREFTTRRGRIIRRFEKIECKRMIFYAAITVWFWLPLLAGHTLFTFLAPPKEGFKIGLARHVAATLNLLASLASDN